jgi:hypothetical protein
VHSYEPDSFYREDKHGTPKRIKVLWQSNNDDTPDHRKANMKFFPLRGKRATLRLNINICQLVDDLLESLASLIRELKRNSNRKKECEARINEYGIPHDIFKKVRGSSRQGLIKHQIELAWLNRAERINIKGEPA